MKKCLPIVLAVFILISGMHLTFATHLCGGELSGVNLSFNGKEATCGMESAKSNCPTHNGLHSDCCKDYVAFYSVDNNYNASSFQVKDITTKAVQLFFIPITVSAFSISINNSIKTQISLTDNLNVLANAVSLANICVFRI